MRAIFFNILILCSAQMALAQVNPRDEKSFLYIVRQSWQQLMISPQPAPDLKVGEIAQIPLTSLTRGQDEISIDNIFAKVEEKFAKADIVLDASTGRWKLAYAAGTSCVPDNDPIEVVKGPKGYVIVDGHHDVFLSLYAGAKNIAVLVRADFSELSPLEFWQQMENRKLIYMKQTPEQLVAKNPEMTAVRDNPNRYLAGLVALKVGLKSGEVVSQKGAKNPAWIKLNNSVAFIEFHIAAVLKQAGIQYDSQWKTLVPEEVIERARVALKNSALSSQIPVFSDSLTAKKAASDPAALKSILRAQIVGFCPKVFSM